MSNNHLISKQDNQKESSKQNSSKFSNNVGEKTFAAAASGISSIVDNRPETTHLQSQQDIMNNSHIVQNGAAIQAKIDSSPKMVTQRKRIEQLFGNHSPKVIKDGNEFESNRGHVQPTETVQRKEKTEEESLQLQEKPSFQNTDSGSPEVKHWSKALPDSNSGPVQKKQEDENKPLQMKGHSNGIDTNLPEPVQYKMEKSFNADFSDVKIHQNSANAENLNALAYTQGKEIHFAPGQYNPQTSGGQELLRHELTHVVQQRQGKVNPSTQLKGVGINDDSKLEKEADEMGKKAAEGKESKVEGSSGLGIQRKEGETVKASNANSTLFELETGGASKATADQDKLELEGVKASETLAEKDFSRISNYIKSFVEVGNAFGIPPALLAAIASRESRAGDALKDDGYAKYDENGYGLMQIDTKSGNQDADSMGATSKEHIQMAAKHFKEGWDLVKKKHPDWEPAWKLRGAVAAYNFGAKSVQTKEGLDEGSTHDDYSSDIWARARYYANKKEFGAEVALVIKASGTDDKVLQDATIKSTNAISDTVATVSPTETSVAINNKSDEIKTENYYTVESGENLEMIARKFNVTTETIIGANEPKVKSWGNVKGFNAGEKIAIPGVNVSLVLSKLPKKIQTNQKEVTTSGLPVSKNTFNPHKLASGPNNNIPYSNYFLPPGYKNKESKINLDEVARKVFKAIDGIGTDEATVYEQLGSLKHNQGLIDQLKKIYLAKYGRTLEEDIKGDFSGSELSKALGYLNVIKSVSNQVLEGKTSSVRINCIGKKVKVVDGNAVVRNEDGSTKKDSGGKEVIIPKGTEVEVTNTKVIGEKGYIYAKGFGWTSVSNFGDQFMNSVLAVSNANYDSKESKHKTVSDPNSVLRTEGPKYEVIKGAKVRLECKIN